MATGPTKEQQLVGGVYNATPITLTDKQTAPLQFDANGNLMTSTTGGVASNVAITDPTQINSGTTGINVFLIDPGTGSALTYSSPTTVTGTGTAGTAATGVVTVQGIASATPVLTAGTGTAGTAATAVTTVQGIASMTPVLVGGAAASLATASGNPLQIGVRASVSSTPPTAATDGQIIYAMGTDTGKVVTKPFAVKEAEWRGTISGTSGALTVSNSANATYKTYVTGIQLGNSNAAGGIITFNDTGSSVFILPAGGGSNIVFQTPLTFAAANTSLIGTITGAGATVYISAQGYFGL